MLLDGEEIARVDRETNMPRPRQAESRIRHRRVRLFKAECSAKIQVLLKDIFYLTLPGRMSVRIPVTRTSTMLDGRTAVVFPFG